VRRPAGLHCCERSDRSKQDERRCRWSKEGGPPQEREGAQQHPNDEQRDGEVNDLRMEGRHGGNDSSLVVGPGRELSFRYRQ
jgi:hypothetical protein